MSENIKREYRKVEGLQNNCRKAPFFRYEDERQGFPKLNKLLKANTFYDKLCIKGGVSFVL